jgi:hypothetical protein
MRPPSVVPILEGFGGTCGFEQSVAQPGRIAPLKIEGLAEYPGFMPASWMRGIQTIVLDLTHIEDCLIAVWQTLRHRDRLASHPVDRKPIYSGAPENGGENLDVQARIRLSDHSAVGRIAIRRLGGQDGGLRLRLQSALPTSIARATR